MLNNELVNNKCKWILLVKIKGKVIDLTMSFEQHIELKIMYMQKEGF